MFLYETIQKNHARFAAHLSEHDFLHRIAAEVCIASLSELLLTPTSILILGHFPLIDTLKQAYPTATYQASDDFHPDLHVAGKYDIIISIGQLQWINEPQDYLSQIRNALNEKGTFYAVFPGDDSFKELHKALVQAEMKLTNGVHQRMIPMISASDALNLLQHTKFTNPLVHVVSIELQHNTLIDLLKDLRHMGGGNPLQDQATFTPKHLFATADQYARRQDSSYIESTVDLVVMIATA